MCHVWLNMEFWKTWWSMSIDALVKLYETGVITKYELFAQIQGRGYDAPEQYREEYKEWDLAHPPGKCLTFSITA